MSRVSQSTPSNVTESFPLSNLTLVVLLLIPCVLILLLLNCLFLGYKFLVLSGKKSRRDPEEMLLQSTSQRLRRVSEAALLLRSQRSAFMCLSEPILPHPVTSSRASCSRERPAVDHGIRLLMPDGATGSGTMRAPSTIRVTSSSSAAGFTPTLHLSCGRNAGWRQSAPVLPQSSDCEAESRGNLVPPNSPTQELQHVGRLRHSSSHQMLTDVNEADRLVFGKVDAEYEYDSRPSEASYLNTSAVGPGLDGDFGASAGVSLRILSEDSDGLSSVLASVLEWDYYDPCYVKQNNLPKLKQHRPAVHTKQYWV
ncbi:protein huluwa [Clinocottus analis]|uniref:protein huluwa n=1 Tax=Clinocottus analis TaxID=304258 RepID=UPI0035C265D2